MRGIRQRAAPAPRFSGYPQSSRSAQGLRGTAELSGDSAPAQALRVRDLALDPATGDLAITAGRAALTSGADAVAQRLRLRLALWRGEYVLDQGVGIPYHDRLGRKGTAPALLEADLRAAAASCPGVDALESFVMTVDAERHATVTLRARATTGEPVSLDAFRVA